MGQLVRRTILFCLILFLCAMYAPRESCAQAGNLQTQTADADLVDEQKPAASMPEPTEQQEPTKLPPAVIGNVKQSSRPSAPDVYLLPDENGKLRKVIGFRYQDFLKAWQKDDPAEPPLPPRFIMQSWSVDGKAKDTQLNATVQLELITRGEGWIEIPIQLPELILQDYQIEDQQTGECLLYDEAKHGYVLWLKGKSNTQRVVDISGLFRLRDTGGTQNLQVHLPRAVQSSFLVNVPESSARFESSEELSLVNVIKPDGTTDVSIRGQTNPISLSWSLNQETPTDDAAPLAVVAETIATVDRRKILYRTKLDIDSFGRPSEQVRVLLPLGAKLKMGVPPNDYTVRERTTVDTPDQRQEIEVRRKQANTKPWTIELLAEQPLNASDKYTNAMLGGFEVLSAFQQSGTITTQIDDQLQAYSEIHGEIEQIPFDNSESAQANQFTLGKFRYTRFPWQLRVFTSPRQRRVSVKPTYALQIDAEEARLDVEFEYQMTGARMFALRLDLHDWQRTDEPIESAGAIDLIREASKLDGRLHLPLVDPNRQQLSLKISLRKTIEPGKNSFALPEALDAFVSEGELTVESIDSLRIMPNPSAMEGLSTLAFANRSTSMTESSDSDLRLRTFLPSPTFSAEISHREGELTADANTKVEINRQQTVVQQTIDYQAKYIPVSQISLLVPEELWQNDSLAISQDGEELAFALRSSAEDYSYDQTDDKPAEVPNALREIEVSLPRPLQGEFGIELSYSLVTPELTSTQLAAIDLPLAAPTNMEASQTASIESVQPVLTTLNQRSDNGEWLVETREIPRNNGVRNLALRSENSLNRLNLFAQIDNVNQLQLTTLERAWIQTWVAFQQYQQRAVFRFRTPNGNVFVQLPEPIEGREIELLLDGQPASYQQLTDSRLKIALSSADSPQSHTLELRCQVDKNLADLDRLRFDVPRLECRVTSAPIYWQLILPEGWLAIQAPRNLIPDYWLGWRHFRWGRQPTLSQEQLEQITQAIPIMAPSQSSTQYIYRAFELPSSIQVTVVRQLWVYFACAVSVFLLGLLCLYTPIARSGPFWLVLSIAFLLGIFSYPEITLLAIEIILVGGLMTFVAMVLKRTFTFSGVSVVEASGLQLESAVNSEPWQQHVGSGLANAETTATLKTGGQ